MFQAEDGIRYLVRSRGLGDVYKRQGAFKTTEAKRREEKDDDQQTNLRLAQCVEELVKVCLLYTSDAADERSSVDLGGRRIIKKKNTTQVSL